MTEKAYLVKNGPTDAGEVRRQDREASKLVDLGTAGSAPTPAVFSGPRFRPYRPCKLQVSSMHVAIVTV